MKYINGMGKPPYPFKKKPLETLVFIKKISKFMIWDKFRFAPCRQQLYSTQIIIAEDVTDYKNRW